MSQVILDNYKFLLEKQKTYHSIEIYPPEMYDENSILKKENKENLLSNINDLINLPIEQEKKEENVFEFYIEDNPTNNNSVNHDSINNDSVNKEDNEQFQRELFEIVNFVKTDWKPVFTSDERIKKDLNPVKKKNNNSDIKEILKEDTINIPFYKYVIWERMDADLVRLSHKFQGWIFVIYGKNELFIDNYWVKIFQDGSLIHCSNKVEFEIKLKMPNGIYKTTDKQGYVQLENKYDVKNLLVPGNRSLGTFGHIFTDMTVLLGGTIANLGSLASEGAVVAAVLGQALKIVDAMHQNVIRYSDNKGKCKFLYDRCNNIAESLQQIPTSSLNLRFVLLVVEKLTEARDLIKKYNKQWKITRFLGSNSNKRKFDNMHSDIDSSFHDFGINYMIDKRIFKYNK